MLTLSNFKNKRILIMGLGLHGGGVGAAAFFARLGSRVTITDLKSRRELAPSVAKLRRFRNITYHLDGHRPKDFRAADYIIKGPGVPETSPFLKIAKRASVPVLSDVEIFFRTCPAPIIGITGTKGKSTATWLLGKFLKQGLRRPHRRASSLRGRRIWVGGNIRKSVLDFLPRVNRGDLAVLELSSFQLDSLKSSRLSPHIALITNVFPDHLNRYPSMASYIASKATIFKFQVRDDVLFINGQDPLLRRIARRAPGRVIRFDPGRTTRPFKSALPKGLPDYHLPNIAAAVAVAKHFGVGETAIRHVLKRFRGMPGRMELVAKVHGILFINDTTATNPTAAEQAVIAAKRRIGRRSLHVIAGGYDKGLPVGEFVEALSRHAATVVFLPGKASERMWAEVKGERVKVLAAKTMRGAVGAAYRQAGPGDVVLLSPGAASFGLFRHEFDRGEQFVKAVRALPGSI